jgi:hypothetical protein
LNNKMKERKKERRNWDDVLKNEARKSYVEE